MKIRKLTDKFYRKYGCYKEILQKSNRPYLCLTVKIDGLIYAIPFRHNINHKYCFRTIDKAGLDFSKSVIIASLDYLNDKNSEIEKREIKIIKLNENKIKYEFRKYIHQYVRALKDPEKERSQRILKYSSLQYFKEYLLNLEDSKDK